MPEAAVLVRAFYDEVWNRGDADRARAILAPGVVFRGSLGDEHRGVEGFVAYMNGVRAALGDYRCDILDFVCGADRAAARMRFSGLHDAPFMGFAPTGRRIEWAGAAFFAVEDGRLSHIWVLGDLAGLRASLEAAR